MCGSIWFVNQLLLKAALLQFSRSARTEVWGSSHLALYTSLCWEKVVLIIHTPSCSQCMNHLVFWLVHGSRTEDGSFFCQSSNFEHFHSIYLLMPSCKHGLIPRQFPQNTTGTPTKKFLKMGSTSLLPASKVRHREQSPSPPFLP